MYFQIFSGLAYVLNKSLFSNSFLSNVILVRISISDMNLMRYENSHLEEMVKDIAPPIWPHGIPSNITPLIADNNDFSGFIYTLLKALLFCLTNRFYIS